MAIFEEESNASQDGNYREHLNRNWHNGNTEFANLRSLISGVYTSISSLWDAITGWTQQLNGVRQQHEKDIDALTDRINKLDETIKKQDARISKLEDEVFNAVYINDTDELPTDTAPVSEDINDTHVVDDNNGVIIEESDPTLPHDIN